MVEREARVLGVDRLDAGVAALRVAAEVRGAGVQRSDAVRRRQARRRGQRKRVHVQLDRDVGGDAAGDVHGAAVPAGGRSRGHVILDEDRLLLLGGDVDGEGVARLVVDLVDGGDHRVGPGAGGALDVRRRADVVHAFAEDAHVADGGAVARERIGGDGHRLGAGAAAREDDVERFELVARGLERGARAAARGVAGADLLGGGGGPCRLRERRRAGAERSDESNCFRGVHRPPAERGRMPGGRTNDCSKFGRPRCRRPATRPARSLIIDDRGTLDDATAGTQNPSVLVAASSVADRISLAEDALAEAGAEVLPTRFGRVIRQAAFPARLRREPGAPRAPARGDARRGARRASRRRCAPSARATCS